MNIRSGKIVGLLFFLPIPSAGRTIIVANFKDKVIMKKILFLLPVLAMLFTACDPAVDDIQPGANVSVEDLTNSFELVAKSEGNNNITVVLDPVRYVKVYNADGDGLLCEGVSPSFQAVPPMENLNIYITAINQDGSITKSDTKSILVTEYTDLPAIFEDVFGFENGVYGTTTWTWDENPDNTTGRYWGNGGWGSDTQPSWWGAPDGTDLQSQCEGKGLPNDGLGAWFSLSLSGVNTSRGETGTVTVSDDFVQAGWDIGTMTFSGTIPLLGVYPNDGNQRCYTYQILRADGERLVLALQTLSNSSEGWFFCFKKIDNK